MTPEASQQETPVPPVRPRGGFDRRPSRAAPLPAERIGVGPPPTPSGPSEPLLVDCDSCCARGAGCGDCFVTVLLGGPPEEVMLSLEERRAVGVLADAGLVPPLRLVQSVPAPVIDGP